MTQKQKLTLALKMKRNGIVNPLWTIQAAQEAGIPIELACAFLEQESGGGHNVFGHDPGNYSGAGEVTKYKYLDYKRRRPSHGMQGVGPMQLTWYTYQDAADRLGGAWLPLNNMRVGFKAAASSIKRYGLWAGIKAYNGSGPAADRYANSVISRSAKWRKLLY